MTRKDYILIADCIKTVLTHISVLNDSDYMKDKVIDTFSMALKNENMNFNKDKFYAYIVRK